MHIAAKYDRHRSIVAYPQRGSGGGVLGNLKNDIIQNYGGVIMERLKRNMVHKVRMKRKQKGGMRTLSSTLLGLAARGLGKMGKKLNPFSQVILQKGRGRRRQKKRQRRLRGNKKL